MVKIIVNADDFGASSRVNDSVVQGLAENKITSATILANSEYLDEVLDITRQFPNASFGVHLNLTAGKSLTQNPVFYENGIMDEKGDFILKNAFQNVPNPSEPLRNAIKEEWQAQISEVLNLGISISHIDGHHHCHTWNGLLPALREVIKDNQIHKVRSTYRYPKTGSLKDKVKDLLTTIGSKSHCKMLSYENRRSAFSRWLGESVDYKCFRDCLCSDGICLTDYFCSFSSFIQSNNAPIVLPQDSSIELMVHPGIQRFDAETEKLFKYNFNTQGFVLSSYHDL